MENKRWQSRSGEEYNQSAMEMLALVVEDTAMNVVIQESM
jgi:hypothetical protein